LSRLECEDSSPSDGGGREAFATRGKKKADAKFFSYEHAEEVFQEAQHRDEVWDCTLITTAKQNKDLICNPIYDWTDSEIWLYIHEHKIKVCDLYAMGYHRVGCIGCPLAGPKKQMKEFNDFPKFKNAYIRAFDRMIKHRIDLGLPTTKWQSGEDVYRWWIEEDKGIIEGQMKLEM